MLKPGIKIKVSLLSASQTEVHQTAACLRPGWWGVGACEDRWNQRVQHVLRGLCSAARGQCSQRCDSSGWGQWGRHELSLRGHQTHGAGLWAHQVQAALSQGQSHIFCLTFLSGCLSHFLPLSLASVFFFFHSPFLCVLSTWRLQRLIFNFLKMSFLSVGPMMLCLGAPFNSC